MGYGIRIKEILRNKGLTIKQLSEMSGVPLNTLYSITKRDSKRIDSVILHRISKALEVSAVELTTFETIDPAIGLGAFTTDVEIDFDEIAKLDGFLGFNEYGVACFRHGSLAEEVFYSEVSGMDTERYRKYKVDKAFKILNTAGQQKAIERIEELTEIPRYQRQPTENAPESTETTLEGKDTTPDETPTETAHNSPEKD